MNAGFDRESSPLSNPVRHPSPGVRPNFVKHAVWAELPHSKPCNASVSRTRKSSWRWPPSSYLAANKENKTRALTEAVYPREYRREPLTIREETAPSRIPAPTLRYRCDSAANYEDFRLTTSVASVWAEFSGWLSDTFCR